MPLRLSLQRHDEIVRDLEDGRAMYAVAISQVRALIRGSHELIDEAQDLMARVDQLLARGPF
jgi:hypothetical protein